ncbi:hypothetical protein CFF01_17530 [Shewanella marisflavi]|uniref:Uncharacterized protein n=1 Tax=Shewanella marisflavi TaxID=260364 RepID=A0AAC9XPR5_9GAMM|nr:hypothetical protein CFF01_17530 [Shewanella marisflavi]
MPKAFTEHRKILEWMYFKQLLERQLIAFVGSDPTNKHQRDATRKGLRKIFDGSNHAKRILLMLIGRLH